MSSSPPLSSPLSSPLLFSPILSSLLIISSHFTSQLAASHVWCCSNGRHADELRFPAPAVLIRHAAVCGLPGERRLAEHWGRAPRTSIQLFSLQQVFLAQGRQGSGNIHMSDGRMPEIRFPHTTNFSALQFQFQRTEFERTGYLSYGGSGIYAVPPCSKRHKCRLHE